MPDWLESRQTPTNVWHVSPRHDESGQPILRVWTLHDSFFKLEYSDATQFLINRSGTAICATWPNTLTLEDTAIYPEGPVLGFVLRLRGVVCLHSSAVAIGGRAIALVGEAVDHPALTQGGRRV